MQELMYYVAGKESLIRRNSRNLQDETHVRGVLLVFSIGLLGIKQIRVVKPKNNASDV